VRQKNLRPFEKFEVITCQPIRIESIRSGPRRKGGSTEKAERDPRIEHVQERSGGPWIECGSWGTARELHTSRGRVGGGMIGHAATIAVRARSSSNLDANSYAMAEHQLKNDNPAFVLNGPLDVSFENVCCCGPVKRRSLTSFGSYLSLRSRTMRSCWKLQRRWVLGC
jgi:hypothetical protein